MKQRVTQTLIDNARPGFVWDTDVPSFGIRVTDSGRKTYIIRFRDKARRSRMHTVGRCCDLSPKDARDEARRLFTLIRQGEDPTAAKHAPTMQDAYERWLEERAEPYNKPATVAYYKRMWRIHIAKPFARLLVKGVTKSDISVFHAGLKHKPTTANRCLAILSVIFAMCERWEWIPRGTSSTFKHPRFKERQREHLLSREEAARLWQAVEHPDVTARFRTLIHLLLLTGCRVSEISTAKVAYVDFERRLLNLPDSKTGAKTVALPLAAMPILADRVGHEYICPGRRANEPYLKPQSFWETRREKWGFPGVRLHDLRHTVGSYAHDAGLSQRAIADLLGHKQLSTTERYIHSTGTANIDAVTEHLFKQKGAA